MTPLPPQIGEGHGRSRFGLERGGGGEETAAEEKGGGGGRGWWQGHPM
jgi:hypothetical protein